MSCERNDTIQPSNIKEQSITVKNGRLLFSDENSFENTLKLLTTLDKEEALIWESKYKFKSLNKSNLIFTSFPLPKEFKSVFNQNSTIQIGNQIIALRNNMVYSFSEKDDYLLEGDLFEKELAKVTREPIQRVTSISSIDGIKTKNSLNDESIKSATSNKKTLLEDVIDVTSNQRIYVDCSILIIAKKKYVVVSAQYQVYIESEWIQFDNSAMLQLFHNIANPFGVGIPINEPSGDFAELILLGKDTMNNNDINGILFIDCHWYGNENVEAYHLHDKTFYFNQGVITQ